MAKYAEVKEKQRNVERVKEKDDMFGRGVWVGFTFGKNNAAGQAVARLTALDDDTDALATIFQTISFTAFATYIIPHCQCNCDKLLCYIGWPC